MREKIYNHFYYNGLWYCIALAVVAGVWLGRQPQWGHECSEGSRTGCIVRVNECQDHGCQLMLMTKYKVATGEDLR